MASSEGLRHTRREMLRLGAAGAAGLCAGGLGLLDPAAALAAKAAAKGKKKPIGVGLQLYSVRRECGADKGKGLIKVIEAVSKMGYEAVEFAGYYGWKPKDLRRLLDDNGLKCCGTHTGLNLLLGDNFAKTVELHKTIGAKFIIVPGLAGKYHKDGPAWASTAKLFNELAAKLKPLGMQTGYHNHSHEFKKFDGKTGWDIFFGGTVKDVVMQLDTGNCIGGGGDPVAIMKRFPGRPVTMHMKEHGGDAKAVVGEGTVKWKQIIRLARTVGGTKWFIIEHERRGQPPVEAVKRCIDNFKKIQASA